MTEVWQLAAPLRWRLFAAALLGAATEAAGLGLMATATWLLVSAAGQPPLHALTVAIVSVRALAISRGGLRYLERLASHDAVLRMITQARARIFGALVDRSDGDRRLRRGDALSRMVSDVDAIQDLVVRVALPIAAAGAVGLAAIAGALLVDPVVGLTLAAGLLVSGIVLPLLAGRWAVWSGSRLAPLRAQYTVDTIDLVHGAADLAAFGARDSFQATAAGHAQQLAQVERALARRAFILDAVATLGVGLTAIAVLGVAIARDVNGVAVAVLAVATLAVNEIVASVLAAARKGAEIRGSLDRVSELLRAAPGSADGWPERAADSAGRPGAWDASGAGAATAVPDRPVTIRLDRASVRYRADGPPALEDITIALPPGRKLAVIGPSGAGKSTLLGLLLGTVVPDSGSVTANGTPIAHFDSRQWPQVTSGLTADAHVFHATIRDNLLLGRPSAGEADLIAATTVAGLGDFISQYGLDVLVGEDGAQLSGGQRQRLALARAVLAAPGVLVLDEPTEGLDPAQADTVLTDVLASLGGSTVVLVTHRLVGLAQFDEVVVLDSGRITQRGNYDELVASTGWVRAHAG